MYEAESSERTWMIHRLTSFSLVCPHWVSFGYPLGIRNPGKQRVPIGVSMRSHRVGLGASGAAMGHFR